MGPTESIDIDVACAIVHDGQHALGKLAEIAEIEAERDRLAADNQLLKQSLKLLCPSDYGQPITDLAASQSAGRDLLVWFDALGKLAEIAEIEAERDRLVAEVATLQERVKQSDDLASANAKSFSAAWADRADNIEQIKAERDRLNTMLDSETLKRVDAEIASDRLTADLVASQSAGRDLLVRFDALAAENVRLTKAQQKPQT